MTSTGESPEDPTTRIAANQQRARDLASEVPRIAGQIAETEDSIAAGREQTAADAPHRADGLLEQAQHAREFAHHERQEQQRWQQVAESEGSTGTTPPP